MNRYIDADKLQQVYKEIHGGKRSLLIDTEPTADVRENVKGEWTEEEHADFYINATFPVVHCNRCDYRTPRIDRLSMNFCPNCGADMRGEA